MSEQQFTTEELETEEWRPVVGYEGIYSVSNLGRVKRETTKSGTHKGLILSPRKCTYLAIGLHRDRKDASIMIHSIVARAFIGERPDGKDINHIDCDKWNNRAINLEYVTRKENMSHAVANGLLPTGERHYSNLTPEKMRRGSAHHMTTLTEEEVREIKQLLSKGVCQRSIAKQYNVGFWTISNINKGVSWKHI